MIQPKRPNPARRGFTLIEAIATITVLAILGSVASLILLNATDGFLAANTRAQLQNETSVALDRIVREFRTIALHPNAPETMPHIRRITATEIEWSDGHAMSLDSDALRLATDGNAARTLMIDVVSFELRAYDANGVSLSLPCVDEACAPIRRLGVTITAQRHGEQVTLRSNVFIRSMMAGTSGGGS